MPISVAIAIVCLVAVVVASALLRLKSRERVDGFFAAQEFEIDGRRIAGADLRVARVLYNPHGGDSAKNLACGFWYCVAPGPRWLLIIAQEEAGLWRSRRHWIVRELTEERMRAALAGDPAALAIAFAEEVDG